MKDFQLAQALINRIQSTQNGLSLGRVISLQRIGTSFESLEPTEPIELSLFHEIDSTVSQPGSTEQLHGKSPYGE